MMDTSVFTDSQGEYVFPWPGTGTYNIIGESTEGLFVLITRISIPDTTPAMHENRLGADTVRLPGEIDGVLLLNESGAVGQSRPVVYLAGTGFITTSNGNGSYSFTKVPSGIYTLIVHPSVSGFAETTLTVTVESGKTTRPDTIRIVNDTPIVNGLSDTVVSINDSVTFSISAADPGGIINRFYWNFRDKSTTRFDTTGSGRCTYKFPSTAAICTVTVTVADSFGTTGSQSAIVTVLRDPPVADAGPDTTVAVNAMYTVHGSGTDRFGKMVMYRFDTNEDGIFEDSSSTSGVMQFRAPSLPETRTIILQVEDDDGNTSNSMMLLDVIIRE
jgi:hypothetical protein